MHFLLVGISVKIAVLVLSDFFKEIVILDRGNKPEGHFQEKVYLKVKATPKRVSCLLLK